MPLCVGPASADARFEVEQCRLKAAAIMERQFKTRPLER